MEGPLILLLLMVLGVFARNSLIVTAAGILIILQSARLTSLFPLFAKRGTELGLALLLLAVLVPFAEGKVGWADVQASLFSRPGLFGLIGGVAASIINSRGVSLLEVEPQVIIGLVIGSIVGALFFKGIPTGPLTAAGIAAFLLFLFGR